MVNLRSANRATATINNQLPPVTTCDRLLLPQVHLMVSILLQGGAAELREGSAEGVLRGGAGRAARALRRGARPRAQDRPHLQAAAGGQGTDHDS